MTTQNPAQAPGLSSDGGQRVEPGSPLSGEVKRGGIKLSPAVRRALAYANATGHLPSFLNSKTYCAALMLLDGESMQRRPKPEVMAEVMGDPLARACAYLEARGYVAERSYGSARRRTSHFVSYSRYPDEGLAGRGGSVTLIKVNQERPYRVSTTIQPGEVSAALGSAYEAKRRNFDRPDLMKVEF